MQAKMLQLKVEFLVQKEETHSITVDLDIPENYNINEFNIQDFREDITDHIEDSYWSGYSICRNEETTNVKVSWD